MAGVAAQLARTALADPVTVALAVATLGVLLRWRPNPTRLIAAGATVGLLEVALGAQVLAGLAVLAAGGQAPLLHYLYGAVVPVLLLVEAHLLGPRLNQLPKHLLFTIAAAVNLLLTVRALATGLGS